MLLSKAFGMVSMLPRASFLGQKCRWWKQLDCEKIPSWDTSSAVHVTSLAYFRSLAACRYLQAIEPWEICKRSFWRAQCESSRNDMWLIINIFFCIITRKNHTVRRKACKGLVFSVCLWVGGYVLNKTCFVQRELVLYDQWHKWSLYYKATVHLSIATESGKAGL